MQNAFSGYFDNTQSCVVIMSGGMDSAIVSRLAVEMCGSDNVHALSFFYQQKQSIELDKAIVVAKNLFLKDHTIIDISFLGDIARPMSSNIRGGKAMPTIQDVLGDPTPSTYVPNRNAIMLMIAAAYAESNGLDSVVTGVQAQDQYGYHDTTRSFIASVNQLLSHARTRRVSVVAPFTDINKTMEIELLVELDGKVDLLQDTMTCYNPSEEGISCGVCPSCAERIGAFMNLSLVDPVPYQINIPWKS